MGKMVCLRNIGSLLLLGSLAACDIGQFTQTQETKEFVISITNDPHPIKVGESVKVYATLRRDRRGVSGCKIQFRQSILEGKDEVDYVWIDMPEGGVSGIYQGRSEPFPVKGDWILEFRVNCTGMERILRFPYQVQAE